MRIAEHEKILSSPVATNAIDDLRFTLQSSHFSSATIEDIVATCPYVLKDHETLAKVTVGVTKARGKKCDRCWYYCESVGESSEHSDICNRCAGVISKDGYVIHSLANATTSTVE